MEKIIAALDGLKYLESTQRYAIELTKDQQPPGGGFHGWPYLQ